MARKVILHVGAPKTGTSFVQDVLFQNRESLAEQGILYAADRFDAHFLAALDLMQLPWGGLEQEAIGRWNRLAAEVRAHDGVAIISHEILGRASRLQVERALTSLAGAEVHVVLSARDLVRQLPAEWQENVKHRRTTTYADFLTNLREPTRSAEIAQWFWGVQELPDVLDRWGSTLPKEHVHLVTVPPPGAPQELLWRRFATVLGVDPALGATSTEKANASLGVTEAALIRRLNEVVNGRLPNHHYRQFVREHLVHQNLGKQRTSAAIALPGEAHEWASELSRTWVAEVALRGYDVVGDLADLLPGEPRPWVDPDAVDSAELADLAVDSLATMTMEAARLREVEIELHAVIDDLSAALDRARSRRIHRAKEKLVAQADTNPAARVGLAAYRRLRGRNSRST